MSLKRHANKDSREHKQGMFNNNGTIIKYDLYTRPDGSLYAQTQTKNKKYHIFIMNELDFLPLDKQEQEKIVEYRIKKFLEKKKSLNESVALNWVKRRANKESMRKYIQDAEIEFPTLCDDFGDEFQYADNVIMYGVNYFLTTHDEMFEDEDYDDYYDILFNLCKDWFGEQLFEVFRQTCQNED